MRLLEGLVVDGHIEVGGEALVEGSTVTVLIEEKSTPQLTDADIEELKASQAEIRRGEYVTVDELFSLLKRKRG
jgi:hypothetical protein